jgi:hypothetical protein
MFATSLPAAQGGIHGFTLRAMESAIGTVGYPAFLTGRRQNGVPH